MQTCHIKVSRKPTRHHPTSLGFGLALLVVLLLALGAAAPASGGQIDVWACHEPDGQTAAPTDRWTSNINAAFIDAYNTCGSGGAGAFGLMVQSASHPGHTYGTWQFTAPPNTSVTGFQYNRQFHVSGWASFQGFRGTQPIWDSPHLFELCQAAAGCHDVGWAFLTAGLDNEAGVLLLLESCAQAGGCDGSSNGWAYVHSARVTLEDNYSPTVSNITGALASGRTLSGNASLSFQSADLGTGIYKVHSKVDGVSWDDRTVNDNGNRCVPIAGLPRNYRYAVPCAPNSSVSTTLGTASLRDGTHAIDITIEDAAGNTTTVLHDDIETSNAPALLVSPSVSGVAQVGGTLSVDTGQWSNSPTSFAYEWSVDGRAIPGATGSSYLLSSSDAYKRLTVRVTATNASGSASTSLSSDLVLDEDGNTAPAGPPNLSLPTISGPMRVGAHPSPSVNTGTWTGATSFDVRWLSCPANATTSQNCTDTGETSSVYTLTAADQYKRLVARVTAHNHRSTTTVDSAPSAVIADINGTTTPVSGDTSVPRPTPKPPASSDTPTPTAPTPPGADTTRPWPNGVEGLVNPLAGQGPHVANGIGATSNAQFGKVRIMFGKRLVSSVRSTPGRRWIVVGRLTTSSGRGIGGAPLVTVAKAPAGRWKAGALVRTDRNGSFKVSVRPSSSNTIRFAYFAFSDSGSATMSGAVALGLYAPSRISVGPRSVSAGGTVTVRGQVSGATSVQRGLLVQVQLYQRGYSWKPVGQARTDAHGRWSLQYETRPGLPPHHVKFRSVVAQQSTWPFLTTASVARDVFIH